MHIPSLYCSFLNFFCLFDESELIQLASYSVKAILDANRNSLMLLDLKFSIGTLGIAAGTLLSALYGMNLKNFIEESDLGFGAVSGACFVATVIVCIYGLLKLRKVQRVRMWPEGRDFPQLSHRDVAVSGRRNWQYDSIEPMLAALPGEGRIERMRRFKEVSSAARNLDSRRFESMRDGSGARRGGSHSRNQPSPSAVKTPPRSEVVAEDKIVSAVEPVISKA
jgi:magnesium transporter